MKRFPFGHATHPQWPMAAALVVAQLRAQMALPDHAAAPTLGLLYITDHYATAAQELLDYLRSQLPEVTDWVGTTGVGVSSCNVEYFDEPALAVMLCELPAQQYRVFSGMAPLAPDFAAHTALVHADARTPDVAELIEEMAGRTSSGYLFGGLASSRGPAVQFAVGAAAGHFTATGAGVFSGGLSGVAFDEGVSLVSRVTQGCRPIAPQRLITAAQGNVVKELDGKPALDVLLDDLQVSLDEPEPAITKLRATLVGLTAPGGSEMVGRAGSFGPDVIVRHIIGLDPARDSVAVADQVSPGMQLAFCQRNAHAARADLMRICAEIREEVESDELVASQPNATPASTQAPARIAGAVYVSCAGRGGPHFGGPSAELQLVRHALGDVPLVGFFAAGEIARQHLYGYTGVLTVFR